MHFLGLGGSSHGGVGAFADGNFVTFHTGDDKVSTKKNLPEYHLALEWRLEHLDNKKKVLECP